MKVQNKNKKINFKVVIYSLLGLICIYLMYKVDWMFVIPVLFFIWLNQRELFRN